MHLKSTLMAAAALLAALPTQAEDGAWYLTARLGAATQASQTLSFSGGGSVAAFPLVNAASRCLRAIAARRDCTDIE